MSLPLRWVLATANRDKVAELTALLRGEGVEIELVAQAELGVASIVETASTFVENALLKARHAALQTGLPAIADDSGLAVDALRGAPGVRSARYAGAEASDAANVAKLLAALEGEPAERRTARFHCALVALLDADDPAPAIGIGEWVGRIATAPRGSGGFGYDPVFYVPELDRTAAELTPRDKNHVSHRGVAARRLAEILRNR